MALGGLGGLVGGQQIAVFIRGVDDLTDPMGKAEKALKRFEKKSKDVETQTNTTNKSLGKLSNASLAAKLALGSLIAVAASLLTKLIQTTLKTEENRFALEKLGKSTKELVAPAIEEGSHKLNNYIIVADLAVRKINELKTSGESASQTTTALGNAFTLTTHPIEAIVGRLVEFVAAEEKAIQQTDILANQQLAEAIGKFGELSAAIQIAKDRISIKSDEELAVDQQIADVRLAMNQNEQAILAAKAEGNTQDVRTFERLNTTFQKNLERMNVEKEGFKLKKDEELLEVGRLEEIQKKIDVGTESYKIQLEEVEKITAELEKQVTAIGKIGSGLRTRSTSGGGTSSGRTSGGSTAHDFISRPGQAPLKFSPQDTIMGVKNPSKMGGANIYINIEGNVVRMRELAREVSSELQGLLGEMVTY